MKSKHTFSKKMPEEVKELAQYFVNSSLQGPRDELLMDWSADVPEVQSSPVPCVSLAGENMSSPCVPLPNRDMRGKRRVESNDSGPLVLNYSDNQPMILSSWDGAHHILSVFRMNETFEIDAKNITQLISRIIDYIINNLAYKKGPAEDFAQVTKAFWSLILVIYSSEWDILPIEDGKTFCDLIGERILNSYVKHRLLN